MPPRKNEGNLWSVPLHGAVLVALLDGRLGPVIETSPRSHETLGLSVRGYKDWGISFGEWPARVKSDVAPYS